MNAIILNEERILKEFKMMKSGLSFTTINNLFRNWDGKRNPGSFEGQNLRPQFLCQQKAFLYFQEHLLVSACERASKNKQSVQGYVYTYKIETTSHLNARWYSSPLLTTKSSCGLTGPQRVLCRRCARCLLLLVFSDWFHTGIFSNPLSYAVFPVIKSGHFLVCLEFLHEGFLLNPIKN